MRTSNRSSHPHFTFWGLKIDTQHGALYWTPVMRLYDNMLEAHLPNAR